MYENRQVQYMIELYLRPGKDVKYIRGKVNQWVALAGVKGDRARWTPPLLGQWGYQEADRPCWDRNPWSDQPESESSNVVEWLAD